MFLYGKHKGAYYFIGTNGVYKVRGKQLQTVSESDLREDEIKLIREMKEQCVQKATEDIAVLNSFILIGEEKDQVV